MWIAVTAAGAAAGLAASVPAMRWAFAPIGAELPLDAPTAAAMPSINAPAPVIDVADFDVALWPADAPVAEAARESIAAPPPPPPPARLKASLVAIIDGPSPDGAAGGGRRAALHDFESDRLVILAPGDSLGAWVLRRIEGVEAELTDAGGRAVTLSLAHRGGGG